MQRCRSITVRTVCRCTIVVRPCTSNAVLGLGEEDEERIEIYCLVLPWATLGVGLSSTIQHPARHAEVFGSLSLISAGTSENFVDDTVLEIG